MVFDFSLLQVSRIIIHEIPRRTTSDQPAPILSEVESQLSPELKRFLQQKFVSALTESPFDVRFDPDTESDVPGALMQYLGSDQANFIPTSQGLATRLANVQTGVTPSSLLAVADTAAGRLRGIAIAKIEREEGLNLNQVTDDAGRRTFSLEHLQSLMFTSKTRLFKIAHFTLLGPNLEDAYGVAVDKQRGNTPRQAVARFFLREFLGCRLANDPVAATLAWFDAASSYISSSVADPLHQTSGIFALQSEMVSNREDLNSRRFAEEHLQGEHRQGFVSHMEASGFDPSRAIAKDIQLVAPRLYQAEWKFSSGIQLIAKREAADSHIEIESLGDGQARAVITDRLIQVRAK